MALYYLYAAFLVTAIVVVREADCLSCYSCDSQTSEQDCKSKMVEWSCPPTSTLCVDGVIKCYRDSGVNVYYLGCGKEGTDRCEMDKYHKTPSCPRPSLSDTTSNSCCSGNLCNSGNTSTASAVVLSMCFALVFLIFALVY